MSLALAVTDKWFDGQRLHVVGTVTPSGSYSTGGDTLNFKNIDVKSQQVPSWVDINGKSGYVYSFDPGTLISNGKMLIHEAAADGGALDELETGAYPEAVKSDIVRYHAVFKMG